MAEIRVERRPRTHAWAWVLLALVIVAAILYYLWDRGSLNVGVLTPLLDSLHASVEGVQHYGQG